MRWSTSRRISSRATGRPHKMPRKLPLDASSRRLKNAAVKRCQLKIKAAVFAYYGAVCVRCGFDDPRALTIDHEGQDGATHLKPSGERYSGEHLYRWLVRNEFPSGFRTLCANCQMIVYRESA